MDLLHQESSSNLKKVVWYAVLSTLRNGFIQAICPALDQQVSINLVQAVDAKKGNIGGLFNKEFGPPTANNEKKKDYLLKRFVTK